MRIFLLTFIVFQFVSHAQAETCNIKVLEEAMAKGELVVARNKGNSSFVEVYSKAGSKHQIEFKSPENANPTQQTTPYRSGEAPKPDTKYFTLEKKPTEIKISSTPNSTDLDRIKRIPSEQEIEVKLSTQAASNTHWDSRLSYEGREQIKADYKKLHPDRRVDSDELDKVVEERRIAIENQYRATTRPFKATLSRVGDDGTVYLRFPVYRGNEVVEYKEIGYAPSTIESLTWKGQLRSSTALNN